MKGNVLLPLAEEWRIVQQMVYPDNARSRILKAHHKVICKLT